MPGWSVITSSSKKGNGIQNPVGSFARAFLVAEPARSSRSHGARVACGRRRHKKKTVRLLFWLSRICFGSAAAAGRPHHTRNGSTRAPGAVGCTRQARHEAGWKKTEPGINYYSTRSGSEMAFHPLIPGPPQRHAEINSTALKPTHSGRSLLRRAQRGLSQTENIERSEIKPAAGAKIWGCLND